MKRIIKWDIIAAVTLFVVVILLGAGLLDRGHEWGDDFAAYLLQGRAIADDVMDEQSRINRIIHASELGFGGEEIPDTVTYVWGYPLVLSAIYKAVGYNPADGGIPIVYKLPNLIAYAAFVAIVYLFYKRRFSWKASLFLALLFALHIDLLEQVNMLMSDIFCLMLSMLSLLLMEIFLACKGKSRRLFTGITLGAVLWYNYEVRLNGVTVIYILLFAQALYLCRNRPARREWAVHLTPYVIFLVLLGISMCMLPPATGNSSHIASGPNRQILINIRYYNSEIAGWIAQMIPSFIPMREYAYILFYVLIAIGVLRAGVTKNLHLTVLMLGTFAVLFLLPYVQPLRYLFNALPLMLLFAAYGAEGIWARLMNAAGEKQKHVLKWAAYVAMLTVVICMSVDTAGKIKEHTCLGGWEYRYDAYSDDALDIYAYIRENTPQNAKIGCVKPRALMLNTGRLCFVPGINGNRYKDMQYMLTFDGVHLYDSVAQSIWPELWDELTEIYRNDSFVLYEMSESFK